MPATKPLKTIVVKLHPANQLKLAEAQSIATLQSILEAAAAKAFSDDPYSSVNIQIAREVATLGKSLRTGTMALTMSVSVRPDALDEFAQTGTGGRAYLYKFPGSAVFGKFAQAVSYLLNAWLMQVTEPDLRALPPRGLPGRFGSGAHGPAMTTRMSMLEARVAVLEQKLNF